MCLDVLEELAALATQAVYTKREYEEFKKKSNPIWELMEISVSYTEAEGIFKARAEAAEAKLKAVGWTPPAKRVVEGQRFAELEEAGHTLPGKVPAVQNIDTLPSVAALGVG